MLLHLPQFVHCLFQRFLWFDDIIIPPKVLVEEQRGIVRKYLVFAEGFADGNIGGRRLDVCHHHLRHDGVGGGKQFAPPVAFEADFVAP